MYKNRIKKNLHICGAFFVLYALCAFNLTDGEYQSTPAFRSAIDRSETSFNQGDFKAAEDWAEKAQAEAVKSGNRNNQARAAYRAGLALTEQKTLFSRNKAEKKFEEAVNLAYDFKIKTAAYQELRSLAKERGRNREVEEYSAAIALLKANISANNELQETKQQAEINKKNAFNTREQNKEMTAALERLSTEREAMTNRINTLSLEQAKSDLLLAEQKNLVDSLRYDAVTDSLDLLSKDYMLQSQRAELREKEAISELATTSRNLFIALAAIGLLVAGGLFMRFREVKKYSRQLEDKNQQISAEQERSNELLLNILPLSVAEELKITGKAAPQHFSEVTVLFTDFEGFSKIAKRMTPQDLVTDLDEVFQNFDKIVGNYGIEKIKTIGDAYMCAGGLPEMKETHPVDLVNAGLDIQDFLRDWNVQRREQNKPEFKARIGIHTGSVVAGVVGSKKFAYDIWGDTVNVAARLETAGATYKVNISENTYSKVCNEFVTEQRGKLPIKNMGEIRMYFAERKTSA